LESSAIPFLLCQHMIVRLTLPLWRRLRAQGEELAKKRRRFSLIRRVAQPDTHPVKVVGHQAIGRNQQLIAMGRVEEKLSKKGTIGV